MSRKVAIVHDYLNNYGGAEKLVNAIYELYPNADIYTAVKDVNKLSKANVFKGAKIYAPKTNGILKPLKKLMIFSYPVYFESIDLSKYQLVISSTAHFAKGLITSTETLHISYIHTPPRFLWGYKTETSIRDKWWAKIPLKVFDSYLRIWDFAAAQRPDYLITNSKNTQKRIQKFYKRDAKVIYPFYDFNLEEEEIKNIKPKEGDFYFTISREGLYKNLDFLAKQFNKLKKPLYIAGSGSLSKRLKKYESKYVKLLGFITEKEKIAYLKGCKAFVLATEDEDFGITPIEAMYFGKPVLALKSGGFKETIIEGKTGLFFNKLESKVFIESFKKLEEAKFDPVEIQKHIKKFSKKEFQKQFSEFINKKLKREKSLI